MAERFQPRTLASFSVHQMEQVMLWAHDNGVTEAMKEQGLRFSEAFNTALDIAQMDEKGKLMGEKGRNRLKLALTALARVAERQADFKGIQGDISVWSTPDPETFEVRWKITDSRYSTNSRLFERH